MRRIASIGPGPPPARPPADSGCQTGGAAARAGRAGPARRGGAGSRFRFRRFRDGSFWTAAGIGRKVRPGPVTGLRMSLDIEALLTSFGDEAPSGPDLEYDPEFIALELAAMPKEEHQVGNTVIAGEEPEYKEVKAAALTVLRRSRDLRAAVMYANAALRTEGLAGFAESLAFIRGALERYWTSLHPMLDVEDNDDPTARVNAITGLTDINTVLRGLRTTTLANSRVMGRFGLREVQIARGEAPPGPADDVIDIARITSAFRDTPQEELRRLLAVTKLCREHVKAIEAVFDEKVGSYGPDLAPLSRMLYEMVRTLEEYVEAEDEPEAAGAGAGAAPEADGEGATGGSGQAGAVPAGAAGRPKGVGTIASRTDVVTAIDRICDYYARHEPSSPVPIILLRAKKLVMADFETIMRDLAPEGLEQWKVIRGPGEGEEEEAPPPPARGRR